MKDSGIEWVGEIPLSWSVFPAGGVFDEVKEKNKDKKYNNPFSFKYGKIVDKKISGEIDEGIEETLSAYRVVAPNTIMINGLNLNYDFISQRVAIVKEKGIITSAYLAVQPNEQLISPGFVMYLLKAYDYRQVFHGIGTGIRKTLKFSDFKNIKIVAPSLNEQSAIAAYLDEKCSKIDEIIASAKASIEDYKQWKASIIYEAVTNGLDPDAEMKDSGIEWIGKIPKHWEIRKLKRVICSPLQYGANETGIFYDESLPRYIRITDILLDGQLKNDGKQSLTEEQAKKYILEDEDILFARSGATVGKTFYYKNSYGRAAFAGYLIRAKTDKNIMLPLFLYFTTNSAGYEKWKETTSIQATIQNIGANRYNDFILTVPPLNEQKEIIDFIKNKTENIDSLINEKESLIIDLESYKKSLIYEVVTGKRKVC